MSLPVEFHPRAIAEARAARHWYAGLNDRLAARFMAEIDRAIAAIAQAPAQWPPYLFGTRFYRLHRFPYVVVFHELADRIQVVGAIPFSAAC